MNETCKDCRFSHVVTFNVEDRIDAFTACREKPPEFIPPSSSMLKPVKPDGWCGQWQKRASATKSVPAPGSDPNTVRSKKLSVLKMPKLDAST